MSEPIVLFSTDDISPETFSDIVTGLGGVRDPNSSFEGRVSKDKRHVWLFLQGEEFKTLHNPMLDEVTKELGGAPKTNVVLEIGREPGSSELAFEVLRAFAKKLPVAVHNLGNPGRVLSRKQLLESPEQWNGFLF